MALLSVDEALARILDGAEPTSTERAALMQAGGRVLAEDLTAKYTQPPFDASAMDGYAVRAADVATLPSHLLLIGQSKAGQNFSGLVGTGQCVRIFTGAPVPAGADAIVIQENTSADAQGITIREGTPDPGHIRARGGDFTQGQALLKAGTHLDARTVMLAAAMGYPSVLVRRKPVVALLATGDELVLPGQVPGPDQIVCSNPFGLAALVRAAGGDPWFTGVASDSRESLDDYFTAAAKADVLVTTGGASVGDHDLVAPALQARGMTLDFWKVAMRPGKPMLFGRMAGQSVLGLPGNPVSALICGRVFLVPLIHAMLGLPRKAQARETALVSVPLEANGPRQHYMRATLAPSVSGPPLVTPVASQDSSLMSPLASSDCLIVREINGPALHAGASVDILLLDF